MSGAWVRSGVLVGVGAADHGSSAATLRRSAGWSGVSPAIFDDPDMPVAAAGVVAFLAQAAKSCDCPTFGLRLAGRAGPVGARPALAADAQRRHGRAS